MHISSAVPHACQPAPQEWRGAEGNWQGLQPHLQALLLGHPERAIRDTARYPPLMLPRRAGGKARARGLRALAAEQLGLAIQVGGCRVQGCWCSGCWCCPVLWSGIAQPVSKSMRLLGSCWLRLAAAWCFWIGSDHFACCASLLQLCVWGQAGPAGCLHCCHRSPRIWVQHAATELHAAVPQEGEHSPVDDARAALYLYHKHRKASQ
jgi:hypothetical protein